MFAAPNPDEIRDVEAQRQAAAAQQNAAMYPPQQQTVYGQTTTDPSMVNKGVPAGTQPLPARPSTLSRVALTMHWGTFLLLVSFFSMMVMIAAAQVCDLTEGVCITTRGYQVAVGVISMAVAFIFGILDYAGRFTNQQGQTAVSAFLFLWWVAGVIVLTFFGDFTTTNLAAGYFSSWGALILSIFALVNVSPGFEQGLDNKLQSVRKPLFCLAAASLVVMGASIGPCSPRSNCASYSVWAVIVSVVSLFVAIVLFFIPTRLERKVMKAFAYLLVLWWVFGVATLTLGGPFQVAGNGFFGSYCALFAASWFASILSRDHKA